MKLKQALLLVLLLLSSGCRPLVWYDLQDGTAARVDKQTTVPLSFNVPDAGSPGGMKRIEEDYPVPAGYLVIRLKNSPATMPASR